MKKISLILFLAFTAILCLVLFIIPKNEPVKKDKISGTYSSGPYKIYNKNKNDSSFIQEDLALYEGNKAIYWKSKLNGLKSTERTGIWQFRNDTLTITYHIEKLYLLEKQIITTGGFKYLKKDTIITRTEPFSIKYLVKKNTPETTICPLDTGQCFDKYLLNHNE